MTPAMRGETVLEVRDLHTHFFLRRGVVKAVDGVSFSLRRGEALGLVGESGCGKSLTALSLMRLLPKGGACTIKGEALLDGEHILERTPPAMREIRGRRVSMVLQDPQTSVQPGFTISHEAGATELGGAAAPLHPRHDGLGAENDRPGRPAHHDRGAAAVADGPAGGLPLRLALLPCRAALPRRLSRHGPGRPRAYGGLLEGGTGMSGEPLLRVEGLRKHFALTKAILFPRTLGYIKAVDAASFKIRVGETLALVGG